eukprot:COSAG01_NODE_1370_length_10548_cov_8.861422_2_plen_51_part_00
MVCIHDIRYVILSTLFPLFMSNQACMATRTMAAWRDILYHMAAPLTAAMR